VFCCEVIEHESPDLSVDGCVIENVKSVFSTPDPFSTLFFSEGTEECFDFDGVGWLCLKCRYSVS